MKIGIDCQSTYGPVSGLGQYTRQLIKWLPQVDSQNDYHFFRCWKNFGGKTYDRLLWENCVLPLKAFRQKLDLLHSPAFGIPLIKNAARRMVVTVHDLIGVVFPKHLSLPSRFYWSKWLLWVNRNADLIIADSESTKSDVIRYMKLNPQRIRVIPLAADERFSLQKGENEIARVCSKYLIRRPFILFLGNVEPRKNLPRLIRAFSQLRKECKIDHQLAIGGSRSWHYPELAESEKSGNMDDIKFIDYVDENDIVALYQASDLFVFPSLYEGFGLPILEAMASGVPVITSKVSSMPEVGGDAVYYVNPYSEEEITKAIHFVLTDRNTWHEFKRRGFERARQFSWKRTAEETLQVFEELLH